MKDFLQTIVFGGAFLVLFIPIIVSDSMYFPFITGKNFSFRIIVEIIFAAWIILALLDVKYRPRLSWLLIGFGAFLGVMLLANLNGLYLFKSFWSNFERMDGYVTLIHAFLYFLVLGSVLSDREVDFLGIKTTSWKLFLGTAMMAASWVAFTAFQQLAGQTVITQGGWRITGTLGNASYMAVYMLFNVFIAVWLFIGVKTPWIRGLLLFLVAVFSFLLVQTATRGTIIGLAGGALVAAGYIAVFNSAYPAVRKIALTIVVVVVCIVGAMFLAKDTSFIQDQPILKRATSINLAELSVRGRIWGMAIEGIKERPALGWGQENFNYVFNREYEPELYAVELWYDRAHNVFVDWLVAGGVLGLLAYLSIFVAAVYYVFLSPLLKRSKEVFSVTERGLLFGILAGYFVHNLVVFDNIVSWIFFVVILAIIHSRVAEVVPRWNDFKVDPSIVKQIIAPVVLVVAIAVVYVVNVPGIQAAKGIIKAITAPTVDQRLLMFEEAFSRNSFADQEITEQLTQRAMQAATDPKVSAEDKIRFVEKAEAELLARIAEKNKDARLHVFLAGLYRTTGQYEKAAVQSVRARELSPNKPAIVIEQGVTAFQQGKREEALAFFKEAHELEKSNPEAQIYYATALVYDGNVEAARAVVEEKNWLRFSQSTFALSAAEAAGDTDLLVDMFRARIAKEPQIPQHYASLAFVYYRVQAFEEAVSVLEEAIVAIPAFKKIGSCYIANIESGEAPDKGCQ